MYPVVIEQLLAQDADQVTRLAGIPDYMSPGSPPAGAHFGLRPVRVPVVHISGTWSYENVDDSLWVLWWVGVGDHARVGEVASAPADAVF